MNLFNLPFFKSSVQKTEEIYTKGVIFLQNNDFYNANDQFKKASVEGHISATYNLALINGGGSISPYDIDFASYCFRQSAAGGHPNAKEFAFWLDKAEDTSYGTIALAMFASKSPADESPNHLLMMTGCLLYSALCQIHKVTDAVIEYELDAASYSEYSYVHNFIKRTGIKKSKYEGGLDRLEKGSAADQITDGLNNLYLALKHSGHSDDLCIMVRCTIVGYIISKSNYRDNAHVLLGVDKFFN